MTERCDWCNMPTTEDESIIIDRELICSWCPEANFYQCECSEWIHVDETCERCTDNEEDEE